MNDKSFLGLAAESPTFGNLPHLPTAACKDIDYADVFFPKNGGGYWADVATARAVCAECPVQQQCLAWALDHNVLYGIWGGVTEHERRAMGRGRPPLTCQKCERTFADPGRSGPRPKWCSACRGVER